MIAQYDVPMKTRDGVTLYADIYRPKSAEKFPVILMRTPYDKSVNWAVAPTSRMVPRGYVVIIQDVRGRYRSEGEWYPFRHEQADGFDAVEWAAGLLFRWKSWHDGRLVCRRDANAGGDCAPPHLAAIART
jgi:putative CocE/NonD family hydrolase